MKATARAMIKCSILPRYWRSFGAQHTQFPQDNGIRCNNNKRQSCSKRRPLRKANGLRKNNVMNI